MNPIKNLIFSINSKSRINKTYEDFAEITFQDETLGYIYCGFDKWNRNFAIYFNSVSDSIKENYSFVPENLISEIEKIPLNELKSIISFNEKEYQIYFHSGVVGFWMN